MLIFKKEKKVVELALRHAEKTGECLQIMVDAVNAYLEGNNGQLEKATKRVENIESEADNILREIRELLYSGAYLPTIRGDIYRLLSAVDSVTNKIEGCLDFINYRKSVSASEYQPELKQILEITLYCFDELHSALRAFFKPKGRVEAIREHCRAVVQRESEIDDLQRRMTLRIYQSSRDLAEKQHLTEMLVRIARISDRMENTADELELVSLKSII